MTLAALAFLFSNARHYKSHNRQIWNCLKREMYINIGQEEKKRKEKKKILNQGNKINNWPPSSLWSAVHRVTLSHWKSEEKHMLIPPHTHNSNQPNIHSQVNYTWAKKNKSLTIHSTTNKLVHFTSRKRESVDTASSSPASSRGRQQLVSNDNKRQQTRQRLTEQSILIISMCNIHTHKYDKRRANIHTQGAKVIGYYND